MEMSKQRGISPVIDDYGFQVIGGEHNWNDTKVLRKITNRICEMLVSDNASEIDSAKKLVEAFGGTSFWTRVVANDGELLAGIKQNEAWADRIYDLYNIDKFIGLRGRNKYDKSPSDYNIQSVDDAIDLFGQKQTRYLLDPVNADRLKWAKFEKYGRVVAEDKDVATTLKNVLKENPGFEKLMTSSNYESLNSLLKLNEFWINDGKQWEYDENKSDDDNLKSFVSEVFGKTEFPNFVHNILKSKSEFSRYGDWLPLLANGTSWDDLPKMPVSMDIDEIEKLKNIKMNINIDSAFWMSRMTNQDIPENLSLEILKQAELRSNTFTFDENAYAWMALFKKVSMWSDEQQTHHASTAIRLLKSDIISKKVDAYDISNILDQDMIEASADVKRNEKKKKTGYRYKYSLKDVPASTLYPEKIYSLLDKNQKPFFIQHIDRSRELSNKFFNSINDPRVFSSTKLRNGNNSHWYVEKNDKEYLVTINEQSRKAFVSRFDRTQPYRKTLIPIENALSDVPFIKEWLDTQKIDCL